MKAKGTIILYAGGTATWKYNSAEKFIGQKWGREGTITEAKRVNNNEAMMLTLEFDIPDNIERIMYS